MFRHAQDCIVEVLVLVTLCRSAVLRVVVRPFVLSSKGLRCFGPDLVRQTVMRKFSLILFGLEIKTYAHECASEWGEV